MMQIAADRGDDTAAQAVLPDDSLALSRGRQQLPLTGIRQALSRRFLQSAETGALGRAAFLGTGPQPSRQSEQLGRSCGADNF